MTSNHDKSNASAGSLRSNTVRSFKVMDVLRGANDLQQRLDKEHAISLAGGENKEPEKVLHLEVGQPETGAPKTVAGAAVQALTMPLAKKNVMGYTDAFGLLELRKKIQQHYIDKYSTEDEDGDMDVTEQSGRQRKVHRSYHLETYIPDISEIVVTTGSSGAFLLAFTAFFDPNDTVAIASSGYPCYRNILQALGCKIATVPINSEYKITAHELKCEIDDRKSKAKPPITGLILSSPSNPTGAMLTPLELKALCKLCNEENIIFMSDEIYHGISYGNVAEATALQFAAEGISEEKTNRNIVVINSFSKYYSMPGWRLGWMVVPPRFVQAINKLQQNMFINAPTVSQTAALLCWDEKTIEELETHVTKYQANRELILSRFDTATFGCSESDGSILKGLTLEDNVAPADGGFYVYVDLGEGYICGGSDTLKPLDSVTMCEELLDRHHVAFTPGIDFEDPDCPKRLGNRRFRISYAGGTENIKTAMDRFTEFWNTYWLPKISASK